MTDLRIPQIEARNLLSTFFITMLIGISFQEMIAALRESTESSGMTWYGCLLALTFFFISVRFFIGNQLHLLSDHLSKSPGTVWLYDLMVIIAQSTALIFLAGYSSVEANVGKGIGFVEILVFLLVVDIAWIISQWLLGVCFSSWKRDRIPWGWAILNSLLVVLVLSLPVLCDNVYGHGCLIILLAINLVGFVVDVVLYDYCGAFGRNEAS